MHWFDLLWFVWSHQISTNISNKCKKTNPEAETTTVHPYNATESKHPTVCVCVCDLHSIMTLFNFHNQIDYLVSSALGKIVCTPDFFRPVETGTKNSTHACTHNAYGTQNYKWSINILGCTFRCLLCVCVCVSMLHLDWLAECSMHGNGNRYFLPLFIPWHMDNFSNILKLSIRHLSYAI